MVRPPARVMIVCSGLGHVNRGFETFARELYETLAPLPELDAWIVNAAGRPSGHERTAHALRRGHPAARMLGGLTGRDPYRIETLTYSLSLMPLLVRRRPDVVVYQDWAVGWWLQRLRRIARLSYRLLFSNGAAWPPPYPPHDHVQQLTPHMVDLALAEGLPAERQTMLPLGLALEPGWTPPGDDEP